MKNAIIQFMLIVLLLGSCQKEINNPQISTSVKTENNLESLFEDQIILSSSTISSNNEISEIINSEFISSKLSGVELEILEDKYTQILNSKNECYAYVVDLIGSSEATAQLVIVPIVKGSNIYTAILTKSILIDGNKESFIAQLDGEDDLNFEPSKAKINKTKQWWIDCITDGYNDLNSDLIGQIAWATNPGPCLAAIIINCALKGVISMTQDQLIAWLCSQGVINCNLIYPSNNLVFVTISN